MTVTDPVAVPVAGAGAVLSPLSLTRVAGLPADTLDLAGDRTRELLAAHARVTAELAAAAPPLVDALFALVPRLDGEVGLRRHVLAGKRAAHRLAALPWSAETGARLRELLPAPAAIDRWSQLVRTRSGLAAALRAQEQQDRAGAVDRLFQLLADPDYLSSLAVAAPDWLRHARPERRRPTSARTLKTLYLYAARASVKTSPFSGLTTVGTVGTGRGRSRSRVTAAIAPVVLHRLAHDERTAALLRFRPLPLHDGGVDRPDGLVLHSERLSAEGISWREDRVVEADHGAGWVRLLEPVGEPGLELAEVLGRLGGGFDRFLRLLDSGVLTVVPPWQRHEDPLAVLADLVGGGGSPVPGAELRRVQQLGAAVAASGAADRVAIAQVIEHATAGWAGSTAAGRNRPSGLVFEDRETDLELPDPLGWPTVAADLDRLAVRLRPRVFRSHLYDVLVDRFMAEFGAGGSTTDPLGFLMRASVERDSDPPLDQARYADLAERPDHDPRAWLPVGPTSAPPGTGLMFQLAAAGPAEVAAGRHLTVVNQFGSGSGALVSRFRPLLGRAVAAPLAAHLERCWPGMPRRELLVWTDCNTAQVESGGVLPALLLPGEPPAAGGLRLQDTVLVHDAGTGTLSLCERDGRPFGLAYLGITPRHLLTGYTRLLGVLADPWVNGSADADHTVAQLATVTGLQGGEVVYLPRVQDGRLVTRRASWVVPADRILPLADIADPAERLTALDRLRRDHDMPEEVFVHQLGGLSAPMASTRKPVWVSWASGLAVQVLLQWLDPAATHLRVVEALPARDDHPVRDRAGHRRVTEHVAHLSWDRPGEAR